MNEPIMQPETETVPAAPPTPNVEPTPAAEVPAAAKTYSEADLETAKATALADYKQHLSEAQDYDKMTAEEKVTFLETQREDEKRRVYASQKLSEAGLPADFLELVDGKDNALIDARVEKAKAALLAATNAAVAARFCDSGYTPQAGNAAAPAESGLAGAVAAALNHTF